MILKWSSCSVFCVRLPHGACHALRQDHLVYGETLYISFLFLSFKVFNFKIYSSFLQYLNFCNFMTKTNFNKTKVLKKYQFSSWKTSKLHIQLIKLSGYLFAILLIKIHWNLHGGNHHPPLVWVFFLFKCFLILFCYDDEMTFRRNIPFCFWVSWEPLCECSQWLTSSSWKQNFTGFSFFLKKKVHTNYFSRWCRRKNSCVKEIWLGGSSSTLQLFMTTLVFSPIWSLWDFELWIEGSLVCFCLRCSLLFLWRGSTCSKFCSQDRKPPRQE